MSAKKNGGQAWLAPARRLSPWFDSGLRRRIAALRLANHRARRPLQAEAVGDFRPRADPNTPQAGIWVSLEPGYRVSYEGYPAKLVIERDGKIISQ